MMIARPYQVDLITRAEEAFSRGEVPIIVAPTGAGKTFILSRLVVPHTLLIAHRRELVSQISCALALEEIKHSIVGPPMLVRHVIKKQIGKTGRSWLDPTATVTVAGVDTLKNKPAAWWINFRRCLIDEVHHLVRGNKWGKCAEKLPTGCDLGGVTATPERADGKGLGRHASGYADCLIIGPTMRSLIDETHLADFLIYISRKSVDLQDVKTGADGDYIPRHLAVATKAAQITGDVVGMYQAHARGLPGLTFCVDRDHSAEICQAYNDAGVPAAAVDGTDTAEYREDCLAKLERGELLQITSVDLFGEGTDLPEVRAISMVRRTKSLGVFTQQFGRGARKAPGKDRFFVFDHVDNVIIHHGAPDYPREWSLSDRETSGNGSDLGAIAVKMCTNCTMPYKRHLTKCSHCQHEPKPAHRSMPEQVDGDLYLLDAAGMEALRSAIEEIDHSEADERKRLEKKRVPEIGILAGCKRHRLRQAAQRELRATMDAWAGEQIHTKGQTYREAQKTFFLTFGQDCGYARTLAAGPAAELQELINDAS